MGTYTVTYSIENTRRASRISALSPESAAAWIREIRPDAQQVRVRDLTYVLRFGGQ